LTVVLSSMYMSMFARHGRPTSQSTFGERAMRMLETTGASRRL
jgi:hypothetical protein